MKKEEKQVLFKDLCARLPYGVKYNYDGNEGCDYTMDRISQIAVDDAFPLEDIKPYLRPMSSMTDDERFEYLDFLKVEIQDGGYVTENYVVSLADMPMLIDWLLKHHFDYRGLIKIGLALEATKDMYK